LKAPNIGQVIALTIRTAQGWLTVDSAHLTDGAGIDNDIHADPLSPRQLSAILTSQDIPSTQGKVFIWLNRE